MHRLPSVKRWKPPRNRRRERIRTPARLQPANFPFPKEVQQRVALGDRIYHGQVGGAPCAGCHGANAAGSPLGPNLTSNKWLWSDGIYAGILRIIKDGVPSPKQYRSPMPPMGGAELTPDQLAAVSAYVWALSH